MAISDSLDSLDSGFMVRYVKTAGANRRIMLGIISCGEARPYSISDSLYHSLGLPSRNDTLSIESMEAIKEEDEGYRALKSALSLLSYADNSKRNLYLKLLRKGYSKQASALATEECVRLGYIREAEQIKRAVIKAANTSLYGRRRIIDKLISNGYSLSQINGAIDELVSAAAVDFEVNFKALCQKKLSKEQMNKENIHALYHKYGY